MATVQHPNAMALSVKRVSISEDRWTESISCISIVPKQSTLNVEGKLFASYIHSNTKHRQWVPFHRINHPYFVRYQMWQKKIDATSTLESKSYKYVYSQTRQQHNGLINDKSTAIRWTKFIFFFFFEFTLNEPLSLTRSRRFNGLLLAKKNMQPASFILHSSLFIFN